MSILPAVCLLSTRLEFVHNTFDLYLTIISFEQSYLAKKELKIVITLRTSLGDKLMCGK